MSSRIMVNVAGPDSIIVPDTGGAPGTISTVDNSAIVDSVFPIIGISLLGLVLIIFIIKCIKKYHKNPKKFEIASKYKHLSTARLASILFFAFITVFSIAKFNDLKHGANAESGTDDSLSLSISTEDININVNLADEPVYAVGRSIVSVDSATTSGYTLMAYLDNDTPDLTNATNPDSTSTINMLPTTGAQRLTDNTWGVALKSPMNKDDPIFRGLPNNRDEALTVKSTNMPTVAGDKTTLYYATYVTPGLDEGVYAGATITYIALANPSPDDITVNYHGNGLYFDEDETVPTNTVIYGDSCSMAYIGGNCTKVYVAAPEIVKTDNIEDNGTMAYYNTLNESQTKTATFPGADQLRVELTYGYDYNGGMYIFTGVPNNYEEFEQYENDSTFYGYFWEEDWENGGEQTTKEFTIDSDTLTFMITRWGEPTVDYYGYYVKITPIYSRLPENVAVEEDTVCHIAKTSNINDEGEQIESYTANDHILQSFTIPGASKIKIVINYALTNEAYITIAKGNWGGWEDSDPQGIYIDLYTGDDWEVYPISGSKEYFFDGDTITIEMGGIDPPIENYDYGFYAKVYPIYDEDVEGSTPIQVCSLDQKTGAYKEPVDFHDAWYVSTEIGDYRDGYYWFNDYDDNNYWFSNDGQLKELFQTYYDDFKGKTIDVYASNYYTIRYHYQYSNGTSGTEDQEVWLPYGVTLRGISWQNYIFLGWNTEEDGSGTTYEGWSYVENLAGGGEIFNLYAQLIAPYVIQFDANGGGGYYWQYVSDKVCQIDKECRLNENQYTRQYYIYNGWNTKADGSGTSYADRATVYNIANSGETITLYAQWIAPYIIQYDANGGTGTTKDTICTMDEDCYINYNNYTRPDYRFTGWNTEADGSGTPYTEHDMVHNLLDSGETITLYAQWEEIITFGEAFEAAGIAKYGDTDYYSMQSITSTVCQNVTVEETTQLMDTRDDQLYSVAKIADGKCWMTKNLNIANGTLLTPDSSNVAEDYLLTSSGGTSSGAGYKFIYNSDSTLCGGSFRHPCYSYYSYSVITAESATYVGDETDAPYDICPKSWRLPTSSEQTALIGIYPTVDSLTRAPFSAVLSGGYNNGTLGNPGTAGGLWASSHRGSWPYYLGYGGGWNNGRVEFIMSHVSSFGARCIVK